MTTFTPPGLEPRAYLFLTVLIGVWGACIGSFLNVCIYRIPREESIVKPGSHCPHCNKPIPWYLNIPILSYLLLRGRCRFCAARITPRYLLVELLVGILFTLTWLKFAPGNDPRPLGLVGITNYHLIPIYWVALFGLVMGTFIDFEHMIIPNRVTLGGILAGWVLSMFVPALHGEQTAWMGLFRSVTGAAAGWGILWGIASLGTLMFRKEAMGFGDVKLLGAIGAFLGWKSVLFTIIASSLAGSIVGISLIVFGGKKMQSRIPYGPYLSLAAVIWIFWGPGLWDAYINLITPAIH